jgi:hypothetical protein
LSNPSNSGFWTQRLRGDAPWRVLFWRDMLTVGSAINLFTGFVALWLVSQDQPIAWALAVHFAPVPYNAFLLRSLWRTPGKPAWAMAGAAVWFAGMLVV